MQQLKSQRPGPGAADQNRGVRRRERPAPKRRRGTPQSPAGMAHLHEDRIQIAAAGIRRKFSLPESDLPDLCQHGLVAAIRAAQRYIGNAHNAASYWTYASKRVRGAMLDFAASRQGEISRRHIRRLRDQGSQIRFVPFTCEAAAEPLHSHQDREDVAITLERLCDGLGKRYAEILRERLLNGLSAAEVGRKLGLTPESVRQMGYLAMREIRSRFSLGVDGLQETVVSSCGRNHGALRADTAPSTAAAATARSPASSRGSTAV